MTKSDRKSNVKLFFKRVFSCQRRHTKKTNDEKQCDQTTFVSNLEFRFKSLRKKSKDRIRIISDASKKPRNPGTEQLKKHDFNDCNVKRRLQDIESEWKSLSVNSLCYIGRLDDDHNSVRLGCEI